MKTFCRRLLLVTMLVLLFASTLPARAEAEEPMEIPAISDFTLKALDGSDFNLESRRGQPLTVISFFATWSPRSATVLAELHKLEDKFKEKGQASVLLVAINAESESTATDFDAQLSQYVKDNNVDFTVLLDKGLATYRAWSIKALPTTFVLDKELKVVAYVPGAPSSIHELLFESSLKALGMESEHPDADAAPTRYQASRNEMLNYGLSEKLLERGSPRKALDKIEIVVEKDLKFPDAQALKGVILLSISEEGETSVKAREAFTKALELDPNLPTAIMGSAYFSALDGDSKGSIEKARNALGQKNWGFAKKPDAAKLAEYIADLDKADALLVEGKTDEGNGYLGRVLEDFVVVRKRVKVDQKRMREMAERAGLKDGKKEEEKPEEAK